MLCVSRVDAGCLWLAAYCGTFRRKQKQRLPDPQAIAILTPSDNEDDADASGPVGEPDFNTGPYKLYRAQKAMPRATIIHPNQSYTFADYFKLNFAPQDILAYFGVTLQRRSLKLPQYKGPLDRLTDLKTRIEESLPRLSLAGEMARREFLIAPVLTDILHYTQATLNVEYPVAVSNQLKGSLDYLLRNDQIFLVIEAKNEDLERGVVQLAVELIALDQWIESNQPILQGAISTGNIWQFAQFDRQSRQVTQDLDLYRVPADLDALLRILVQILTS